MNFRLGTTSYIYPADLLWNVQRLVGLVEDVELVLFETADASNLPDAETIAELWEVAYCHGLTYTVHLSTDLQLGASGKVWTSSVEKARRFIRTTRPLNPWAYIVHLNPDGAQSPALWREQCLKALETLAEEAGGPGLLAVENLENCPLECLVPILEKAPVSLCLDVGHFWLAGADPLPALRAHLGRTRVVHLHGVNRQDHESLAWVPADALRAVLEELVQQGYGGVVTLEVFSAEDFFSSWERLLSLLKEILPI
ncbi:MAG: cobamide remodeling phosphodiesterase CbiR [Anaerolineae bacterium]|nr:sugar phosphate isomerase/epimerase [Anaerolineae bacterium]MDW7992222.1 cobamide remodeling phosphodiesterase CbiR [Anaerolineae bacterium]